MMVGCPLHSGDACFNDYFSPLDIVLPKAELQRGMTINTLNNHDLILFYVCLL